jgi:tight adherence protein B
MFGANLTIIALVGLVTFSVAGLLYALLFNRVSNNTAAERVNALAGPAVARRIADPAAARRRSVQDALKDIELKQKVKASRSTSPPMRLRLQQAGLKLSVRQFVLFSILSGLAFFGIGYLTGQYIVVSIALAFVGGFGFPRWLVNFIRKRRQKAFVEELPNAVDVIVRGVKAGLPLGDTIRMISVEAKEPLRSEFKLVTEAQALGVPFDEGLARLYERMPLAEANFLAIVIAIQSKAGGNLSEALGNLARVLRERKKMRNKIQAMSMEAKASASIIGSLPVIVAGLVYITSPDYISLLWTEPMGQIVLGISLSWMATGIFVMKRMINFDF